MVNDYLIDKLRVDVAKLESQFDYSKSKERLKEVGLILDKNDEFLRKYKNRIDKLQKNKKAWANESFWTDLRDSLTLYFLQCEPSIFSADRHIYVDLNLLNITFIDLDGREQKTCKLWSKDSTNKLSMEILSRALEHYQYIDTKYGEEKSYLEKPIYIFETRKQLLENLLETSS